jgi:RND family efflux transporter MFP subunit
MSTTHAAARAHGGSGVVRGILITLVAGAGVVLLLMWLAGSFKPKVAPGAPPPAMVAARGPLAVVQAIRVPQVESAVGTIRAVQEATLAAEVLAKVVAVNVQAGQRARQGDVLVKLDDVEFTARVREADAIVAAATANRDQAKIEYDRVLGLHKQASAADIELQRADTAFKDAEARVEQARQAQRAAAKNLDNTVIRSPFDGVVVEKFVEVGDTVSPQTVMLRLYDPTRMQLVANVRESLINRVKREQVLDVQVEAIGQTCKGAVTEIVPQSDVASRTFIVKVAGPCPPEIHSGMFGRLLIPLEDEEWIVIPRAAVRQIGQLDLVEVAAPGSDTIERRAVKLGRTRGEDIEVLAGLKVGERVVLPAGVP